MASTPLRLTGLLVKEEDTYGTDPTPTIADNGVRASGELWTRITPRQNGRFGKARSRNHCASLGYKCAS